MAAHDLTTDSVSVAVDVGPLFGQRTGIGHAVDLTVEALGAQRSIELLPYVTSMRARVVAPQRRLPIPAAVAHRWWRYRAPRLDRLLGRPDVVHGTNYVVPPTRCPRVVSVYDCWFLEHPDDADPAVRRAGEVLRRAVDDGATIVASSDATASAAKELLSADNVRTILLGPPRPTDAAMAAVRPAALAGLRPGEFIVAVGTLEKRKNLPQLVDAFGRVAHELPTAHLVIAGAPGDDSDRVLRHVEALRPDAARRVTLLGRVDEAGKHWLLSNAGALAYPSLDEGFGFPILEAHQAGVAVVASTAGSIPEVAANAALMSPTADVDALAANLHWVLTSEDIRNKLIRRGRANLRRFSWDSTAHQLAELYHELVEGTP